MSGDDDDLEGAEAESLIPYDEWIVESMRRVVYLAMWRLSEYGLPGDHHYFITFNTQYPGVAISPSLQARFPDEMRIVIQHQYERLSVDEEGFAITLHFGGVPEYITVPYAAISEFLDPAVHFALGFEVELPPTAPAKDDLGGAKAVTMAGNVAHLGAASRPITGSNTKKSVGASPTKPNADAPASPQGDASTNTNKVVTLDAFRAKQNEGKTP